MEAIAETKENAPIRSNITQVSLSVFGCLMVVINGGVVVFVHPENILEGITLISGGVSPGGVMIGNISRGKHLHLLAAFKS